MTEELWFAARSADGMLRWLRTSGAQRRSPRKIGLFALACADRVRAVITDEHALRGFALAERVMEGVAGEEECNRYILAVHGLPQTLSAAPGLPQTPEQRVSQARAIAHATVTAVLSSRSHLSPEKRAIEAAGLCGGLFFDVYDRARSDQESAAQASLLRDIAGNPFRPVAFSLEWRTSTAVLLAKQMYDAREFSAMPILADALQDAGCDNEDVLSHCRDTPQTHVRGCWVTDLVLNKV
jgi:hypothetical protein